MKTKNFLYLLLIFLLPLSACKDDEVKTDPGNLYLNLSKTELNFFRIESSEEVEVSTNIGNITATSKSEWCEVKFRDGKITVTVLSNDSNDRNSTIEVEGGDIKKEIKVSQKGRETGTGEEIKDDILIKVKGGEASSTQGGEGIERTFDGDKSTIYHSKWDNSAADYFPITLSYFFEDVPTMDYLVYNPRSDGGINGNIKEFDLYIATESNSTLTKYGSYDFGGSGSASRISFSKALEKPTKIQFVVKSGVGGFVSCAEMEFFKKNPDNFDYLTIFSDHSCSEIKAGVTLEQIEKIENVFFKELAFDIKSGVYPKTRIQEYKSWQHPDISAASNKTSTYGLRDNPTGLYATTNEDIVILCGDTKGQNVTIFIQDIDNKTGGVSFPLSTGINKIKSTCDGLMYVLYYTKTGTESPVKINIVNGTINGYFDKNKNKEEEWAELIKNATFKHFDVVGDYSVITFETEAFRKYTSSGLALINKYDELVLEEQKFMGLQKYNKAYKNRAYFLGIYDSHMYATAYYTGYNVNNQPMLLDVNKFLKDIWGPAHELGHVHQTRPGFRWFGMQEVTNNIHAIYIQTLWGNKSRLLAENLYKPAFDKYLNKGIAHHSFSDSQEAGIYNGVFQKLIPFWQLKLYIHDILGNQDFYKDVYEYYRNNTEPNTSVVTDGVLQVEFVRIACDIAKLDLTAFFESWGFLTPVDTKGIMDKDTKFTITQDQITKIKDQVKAKNYPKPKHDFTKITDENISDYK